MKDSREMIVVVDQAADLVVAEEDRVDQEAVEELVLALPAGETTGPQEKTK